jgi:hypothetical protein
MFWLEATSCNNWPKSRFLVNSLQRSPRHQTLRGSSRTKPSLCIKIWTIFPLKPLNWTGHVSQAYRRNGRLCSNVNIQISKVPFGFLQNV